MKNKNNNVDMVKDFNAQDLRLYRISRNIDHGLKLTRRENAVKLA